MAITLHTWTPADKPALMALCNAVDRTYLSDRLPYPYTEADADWWLGMVAANEGKEGVWRAIVVDGQVVGSISVERMADEQRNAGSIGYIILTAFWSRGIGTEAVRQICEITFRELALERIVGEVFSENLASARVLEKNGFLLEETRAGAVVKGGKRVVCHLLSDLDQLPGEVSSCRRVPELSTEHSTVALSYLHELGDRLPCEHVVNWFCVKEPMQDLHGKLDSKRRQMQSMSLRNAQNRKYAEEINEYLEKASVEQMTTVRCHLNVFSTDEHATTSAISRLGLVPVRDMSNAPAQMWASIPGNESGLAYTEYMTLELRPA